MPIDNATLLAGSLGLSAIAMPIIGHLYVKNISKDMTILKNDVRKECKDDSDKMKTDYKEGDDKLERELKLYTDSKFDFIINEISHKKISIETLDKISRRLVKVIAVIDPENKKGIYNNDD